MDDSLAELLARLNEEWKEKMSVEGEGQQVGPEQNSLNGNK